MVNRKIDDEDFGTDDIQIILVSVATPEQILGKVLPVLYNEAQRLQELAKISGLKASAISMLCNIAKTASDIKKAHPRLNLDPITDENLDTMPQDELVSRAAQVFNEIGVDMQTTSLGKAIKEKERVGHEN